MSEELVRVGRWMSRREYDLTVATGYAQESTSGTTHVLSPAGQAGYQAQAAPGSLYVEFEVPAASLKRTQEGWAKILGPHTVEARLAAGKGQPIPQMPPVQNVRHVATK